MLIKDICKIINGATPSTGCAEYWDGDIAWLTPKDLSGYTKRYISCGERSITQQGYNSCSTTLVPKNTILLTSRAPIGYLAIAEKEVCTNQGFKSIICDKNKIIPLYLFYWLQTRVDYLKSISNGATFKELSKDTLENVKIELPDISTQQHIVDTIGSVDDLIEKYEETIKDLKIFSDRIYSKYCLIKQVKTIKLGQVCKIITGKLNANACSNNGKYPFFTCSQNESKIDYYAFDTKAIVIAGNGDISVKYYEGKFNAYQRTYVLTPSKHFYLFLKECENSIGELKSTSQGSVIKFITKEMLENITITENNYACLFNEKLYNTYSQIMNLQHKINTLKKLKTNFLKKYFG